MLNFLSSFLSNKSIQTIASRLVNKYTAKSFGFFGSAFLIYASVNNIDSSLAEFIANAMQNWDINNFDILISLVLKILIYLIIFWLIFLTIDNLFRKSIKEPTLLMLMLQKFINKKTTKIKKTNKINKIKQK